MRGTQGLFRRIRARPGIIPAHAGNTFQSSRVAEWRGDHPRACGEHGSPNHYQGRDGGSSPRMRGTPLLSWRDPRLRGIIPAHAGNTATMFSHAICSKDHPRACGEHRFPYRSTRITVGSSPRMRGTPDWLERSAGSGGIIPAHAGNTLDALSGLVLVRDHPRACGEHNGGNLILFNKEGSSPRMRGTLTARAHVTAAARDHPRACGEHQTGQPCTNVYLGSSPRMRGTPHRVTVIAV